MSNRRNFIYKTVTAGLSFGVFGLPMTARAAAYHVVVVGGGMAGATVAKYLRTWSQGQINVTLIEKDASYTSNIMSNEVVTGKRVLSSLSYSYSNLTSTHGVKRVQGTVTSIDSVNKTVTHTGGTLSYDRLVLAPGLDFDLMPGMSSLSEYESYIPHAWKAGAQTTLLRNQLLGLADGGNVVITIPLAPYRCPPGPYERACVIADWLRNNGKPNSKVILLDANSKIQAEEANFLKAFGGAYGYTVDYRPNSTITNIYNISNSIKTVNYNNGTLLSAAVLNPIPPQRAPAFLVAAGVVNPANSVFAPVNLLTFESQLKSNIHVIGDACISGVPKAGHIANQEAKTCANGIVNALLGNSYALSEPSPVLNSACFTPVTSTQATWLSAVYQYSGGSYVPSINNSVTQPRASSTASTENYSDMNKWFSTLMKDSFS